MYQNILGYTVYSGSLEQCVDSAVSRITNNDAPCWLVCINPHSYVAALDESEFSAALHEVDWLIPDGSGIVLASHVLGGNIRQRITGSDIFYALNTKANELGGLSVFVLGSTPDCLEEIRVKDGTGLSENTFCGELFSAIQARLPCLNWRR